MVAIGKAVGYFRLQARMTQRTLADRTGLTVNYLSLLENGMRTPSLETLYKIAKVLGRRVSTLFLVAENI